MLLLLHGNFVFSQQPPVGGVHASLTDLADEEALQPTPWESTDPFDVVSYLQPQPLLIPNVSVQPATSLPSSTLAITDSLFGNDRTRRAAPGIAQIPRGMGPATDLVFGAESSVRLSTDAGNLLGKSPSTLGMGVQRRSPIVTDPRPRGSRVGRLAASGSYWIPARVDLDTMLSKIDSRSIADMTVIQGPYSALYGPGFNFVDVQLLPTPRYADGPSWDGSSSVDYKSNGRQVYGRQALAAGAEDWGARFAYGHRTGNDYRSGDGTPIPASYNSRDFDVAFGCDLTADSHIEFNYLRLDQTNVELPGQAFDIDWLVTDGYEVKYVVEEPGISDRWIVDAWYNRTRLEGNAQNPSKRRMFPLYDLLGFIGNTSVDSESSGFRTALAWGDAESGLLLTGLDLRYVRQSLDEITSGRFGFAIWEDANSPIPPSHTINPGLFVEYLQPISDDIRVRAGGRLDTYRAAITESPANLQSLGTQTPQMSLADILGTDQWTQNFTLPSLFLTGEYEVTDSCTATAAAGFASQAPTLTDLYAAQPFMFLLQNGLNTVTGDPRLRPEKLWQVDLGVRFDNGNVRSGARAFHAWIQDYITFENMNVFYAPPFGQPEQVSLKYVNTGLATLTGGEAYGEFDWNDWLVPFVTLAYVQGVDQTRHGSFATKRATPGSPSVQVAGLPRGAFSGVSGNAEEPLPSILPLESRLGLRFRPAPNDTSWFVEFSARMVDRQRRVAASLLETPTPGFTVLDLRASWQPASNLRLVAGAENLADRNYREHLDYRSPSGIRVLQPGVNVYVGTELLY